MGNKQLVSDLLGRLPDDISLGAIAKEVEFMAGIKEGLDQLDRAEGVPIEAVEKLIASWTTG
jgi:predicted transcriptional regulator